MTEQSIEDRVRQLLSAEGQPSDRQQGGPIAISLNITVTGNGNSVAIMSKGRGGDSDVRHRLVRRVCRQR